MQCWRAQNKPITLSIYLQLQGCDWKNEITASYLFICVKEGTHCTVRRLLAHAEVEILLNFKVAWFALPHGSQEPRPGIRFLRLRCWLLGVCGVKELMSGNTNKHVMINEQHAAGSNHHRWSSLWAEDEGAAACWAAAVSSSCSYSLFHPPSQAEERKIR